MTEPSGLNDVVTSASRRRAFLTAGLWDESTLPGQVAAHAAAAPAATSVVDAAGRHSYADLAADAAALAASFAERGVSERSVVSIQLPNRYEAVVAAVATLSLGGVVNPLLPNYRLHELVHVFRTAAPAVVVTPGVHRRFDHRSLVDDVRRETGLAAIHVVVGDEAGRAGLAFADLVAAGGDHLATGVAGAVSELIFTSGTEATPKAIMHTEQTANFSVRVAYADLGLGAGDVVWMPSPVGHSTGFNYGVRFALYHRLPLVLQDVWDPVAAATVVEEHRCSYTLAATTFLQDLVGPTTDRFDLSSLRYFGCGGAPVPPALVDAAADRHVDVLRLYGSTEVLVGTWNRPDTPAERKRVTDGVAMTDVELSVRDADDRPVAPGEPGELFVRGPNTCVGFFADPERTSATFDGDGWVRSGDLVTVDGDGSLTVVGRKKEILIRGGINIAPREVEELLVAFPEVERAAVVGLPDERLGERMCACVVLAEGAALDFDTMVGRLRDGGLAVYKLPERLEVLPALPSTASGKIQKHELVRRLGERVE